MSTVSEPGSFTPELSRPNSKIAQVVEAGILLKDQKGKTLAADFLSKNGVPFNVIVRVMADPAHRRQPVGAP